MANGPPAGTTESGNSDSSVGDFICPDEQSGRGTAYVYPGQAIQGRIYAWASVIEDGRVVATATPRTPGPELPATWTTPDGHGTL